MPLPIGLLEWNPATGAKTITEISANGSGDTATNPNYHVYRWNSFDTINLSGTEWQVTAFWDDDEHLVIGVRSGSPGSISAASWTLYVYDGVAETPEILRSELDNHNNCNVGLDSDGYLHVAYDHHNVALNYRRSTTAITSFSGTLTSELSMLGTNESDVAYPTFFRDPLNTLYFIMRSGTSAGSGTGNLYFYKYTTSGQTWAAAAGTGTGGLLIDGKGNTPDESPYWAYPYFDSDWDGAGTGYMHLAWVWREVSVGGNGNHDISYVRWDGTTFTKTTGAQTVPILLANTEIINAIPKSSQLIGFPTMVRDSSNNPHVFTTYLSGGFSRVFRTYHNGSSWATTAVTPARAEVAYWDSASSNAASINSFIESDDTIHVVVSHPTGIGTGQYVFSSNGSTWTDPWIFSVLTRQDLLSLDGTKTDINSSHDRYQWKTHATYQSLVPLSSQAAETIDEGDWPYAVEATITKGDSDVYHGFFVIDGAELPAHFWANVKSDLSDVRLTDGDGLRLPVYVHNYNYGSETATIFGAFPEILPSAGTHKVQVHYGNASASAEAATHNFGRNRCFNPFSVGVYPDGGGNDVTVSANNLTASGSVSAGGVAGPFGTLVATDYNGSSQYYSKTPTTLGTPTALAIVAWTKSDSSTASQSAGMISDTAANNDYLALVLRGDLASPITDPVQAIAKDTATASSAASSSNPFVASTWQLVAARQGSDSSRYAIVNGVAGSQDTNDRGPMGGLDALTIGAFRTSSVSSYFDGAIALTQFYLGGLPSDAELEWQYLQADQATFWGTWSDVGGTSGLLLSNAAYFARQM